MNGFKFRASLRELIEVADEVVVDGYEIDEFVMEYPIRMACGEDHEFSFTEQDVSVDVDGTAVATDVENESRVLTFKVKVPVSLAQLT